MNRLDSGHLSEDELQGVLSRAQALTTEDHELAPFEAFVQAAQEAGIPGTPSSKPSESAWPPAPKSPPANWSMPPAPTAGFTSPGCNASRGISPTSSL